MADKRLVKFFNPSPFKIGCLVILAAALLYHSFGSQKPPLLESLDNRITDAMFRWRGKEPTTGSVVIVDIDEKSMRSVGQWPWPRDVVAALVRNIRAGGAKVIGFDIVFAEEDRTSPRFFLEALPANLKDTLPASRLNALAADAALDHDRVLGSAVAQGRTVLGYVFQTSDDGLKTAGEVPFPSCIIRLAPEAVHYADLNLLQAYRAIVNIPDVAQAETEGFFNVFPDAAGTVRSVPLFMQMDGLPYPCLALEMLRLGLQAQEVVIHASRQQQAGKNGLLGVEVGGRFIPTNDRGEMTINFRGPVRSFSYMSAVDILKGERLHSLRDRYVLIGTSAYGLLDLRATPFSNVYPGVEVHASIIDNVLAGDPFTYDIYSEIGLTFTLILIGGLLLNALLAYGGPVAGGLGGILVLGATIFGNYALFFLHNKLLGVTYPLLTALTVFVVVSVLNYFFEGREKRFIDRAFGRYVSPQVVQQLKRNPEKLTLAGEQKILTVLFSDIRGFTSISEKMTSEQLGQFMNDYLTAMSGIIMEHKGTVDKFIGDAVMAVWGAPLDDQEHAANTVRAAFHMLRRLNALRAGWQRQGLPFIDIGIGINTGAMSVGNFGSTQRFDYTVMGDHVNLAARLEGSNKIYGTNIIISEYTKEALGDRFFCRFLDVVRVKGKKKPVQIFEPLCEGEPLEELRKEVQLFEQAMSQYRGREFASAAAIIKKLNQHNPLPIYSLYLQRIDTFLDSPPPSDWDGATTFTTK